MKIAIDQCVNLFLQLFNFESIVQHPLFLDLFHSLDLLSPGLFLNADSTMNFCQFLFLTFHCTIPFKDTHNTELILSWSKIVRKISNISKELFIDLIFFDIGSDLFQLFLFTSNMLLFLTNILASFFIAPFKFFLLL